MRYWQLGKRYYNNKTKKQKIIIIIKGGYANCSVSLDVNIDSLKVGTPARLPTDASTGAEG